MILRELADLDGTAKLCKAIDSRMKRREISARSLPRNLQNVQSVNLVVSPLMKSVMQYESQDLSATTNAFISRFSASVFSKPDKVYPNEHCIIKTANHVRTKLSDRNLPYRNPIAIDFARSNLLVTICNLISKMKDVSLKSKLEFWAARIRPLMSFICLKCHKGQVESFISPRFEEFGCSNCEPDSLAVLGVWMHLTLAESACTLISKLSNYDDTSVGLDAVITELKIINSVLESQAGFWTMVRKCIAEVQGDDPNDLLMKYITIHLGLGAVDPESTNRKKVLEFIAVKLRGQDFSPKPLLETFDTLVKRADRLSSIQKTSNHGHYINLLKVCLGHKPLRHTTSEIIYRIHYFETQPEVSGRLSLLPRKPLKTRFEKLAGLLSKIMNRDIQLGGRRHNSVDDQAKQEISAEEGSSDDDGGSVLDIFMGLHGSRNDFFGNFAVSLARQFLRSVADNSEMRNFLRDSQKLFDLISLKPSLIPGQRDSFDRCLQILDDAKCSLEYTKTWKQHQVFIATRYSWPADVDEDESSEIVNDMIHRGDSELAKILNSISRDYERQAMNRTLFWDLHTTSVDIEIQCEREQNFTLRLSLAEAQVLCTIVHKLKRRVFTLWQNEITGADIAKTLNVPGIFIRPLLQKLRRVGCLTWDESQDPLSSRILLHDKIIGSSKELSTQINENENVDTLPNPKDEGENESIKQAILDSLQSFPIGVPQFFLYPRVQKKCPDLVWTNFTSTLMNLVTDGIVLTKNGTYFLKEM